MNQEQQSNNQSPNSDDSELSNIPLNRFAYWCLIILIIQVAFAFGIWFGFPLMFPKDDPYFAARGQFGDMFGALNSLFSGLAFAGIIYALLIQRKDFELQRKDYKRTNEELQRATEAQNKQAVIMYKTAQLTALTALAEAYRNEIETLTNQRLDNREAREKFADITSKIKMLTDEMINSISQTNSV